MKRGSRKKEPKPMPSPELAPIQKLIADEVAHLLADGEDTSGARLLIAAAAHHWRWRMGSETGTGNVVQRWERELMMAWREGDLDRRLHIAPEPASSDTVTRRIRAGVITELICRFQRFLVNGTPEEHRLLAEILTTHDSCNRGRDSSDGELVLAEAFEMAL